MQGHILSMAGDDALAGVNKEQVKLQIYEMSPLTCEKTTLFTSLERNYYHFN